jgi:two-component system response regulator DevR
MNQTRIFLVDDEPVVRRGLQLLLSQQTGMNVVGCADSVASALAQAPALHPDIIILDLTLKDGDGFRLITEFRASCPGARLLVFSMHGERAFIEAAIRAGADEYVVKDQGTEKLLQAVKRLVQCREHNADEIVPLGSALRARPGITRPGALG